ncbi:uncharacterized protein METZ01_LOCUS147656 [marine metagenome]|uniref:Uncharacterized protein n=1 Tax=marine metagenome TaxID=408172 RepID=A0A382A0Y8_9ZZZZ
MTSTDDNGSRCGQLRTKLLCSLAFSL